MKYDLELEIASSGAPRAYLVREVDECYSSSHFVGHGGADSTGWNGQLALENEEDETTGRAAWVSAGRFAELVYTRRPARQLVLNSWQSREAAADDLPSNTAGALVSSVVNAGVAMQSAVTDAAALAFARVCRSELHGVHDLRRHGAADG